MKLNTIELFAGVGGFHLGLKDVPQSIFDIVWANQFEPTTKSQPAFECYSKHFSEQTKVSNTDISLVDVNDIPKHDLLVGGFPCQDYSVATTKAKGLTGKKGVLFWEIYRIAKFHKPKYLLLENVDRLLKSPAKQRGRDFAVMLKTLGELGYTVHWRVINAASYGYPQRRKRVFIFASLKNMIKEETEFNFFEDIFPIQSSGDIKTQELLDDVQKISDEFSFQFENDGIYYNSTIFTRKIEEKYHKPTFLQEVLEKNVPESYYLDNEIVRKSNRTELNDLAYKKSAKRIERVSKTGHPYVYSEGAMSFPDKLDKPARTMLTSEGSINRSTHVIADPETKRLRYITPVECERLNGFPDNWTNILTTRQRYFMMGNALVVPIVTKIARKIQSIHT